MLLNLGFNILGWYDNKEDLKKLVKDKIVIVGDFVDDIHLTYNGYIPGPMLTYYAFRELEAGKHIVSFSYMGFLFVLYLTIGLAIMFTGSWYEYLLNKWHKKWHLVRLLFSLIGLSMILYLAMYASYMIWDVSMQVEAPGCVYALLTTVVTAKKFLEQLNNNTNEQNKITTNEETTTDSSINSDNNSLMPC